MPKEKNINLDIDSYTLHKKLTLKWIRDINIKYKNCKIPRIQHGRKPDKLGYDDDLLGTTPEVQPMRQTIDK